MTGCGGLSGEHIQLCAEGARLAKVESLRQTDGDKQKANFYILALVYRTGAVQTWAALIFCNHSHQ